jgi:hypothetical protein
VIGVWRRLILEKPGHAADRSTSVFWMQAPNFFVDLRQAPDSPDFEDIRCLADLGAEHLDWLATQEGFAGSLHLSGGIALWGRDIDFQPKSPVPDRARVDIEGEYLHEQGTEAVYYEKWTRGNCARDPAFGLKLECVQTKCQGYIVRVGQSFMFARDRPDPLPEGECLSTILDRQESLDDKRALVDFEISLGEIGAAGAWSIRRSTLPFRVGRDFVLVPRGADELDIEDTARDGRAYMRTWRIVDRDIADDARSSGERAAFAEALPAPTAIVTPINRKTT